MSHNSEAFLIETNNAEAFSDLLVLATAWLKATFPELHVFGLEFVAGRWVLFLDQGNSVRQAYNLVADGEAVVFVRGEATFDCVDCKRRLAVNSSGGSGYGLFSENPGAVCYACCAVREESSMVTTGVATLYYTAAPDERVRFCSGKGHIVTSGKVSNWCGTLNIETPQKVKKSRGVYNGRQFQRYDVWFCGPDGARWHGVCAGMYSQILRCKRIR